MEIAPVPPFNFSLTVRKPAGWDLFTSEEIYEDDSLAFGRMDDRSGLASQQKENVGGRVLIPNDLLPGIIVAPCTSSRHTLQNVIGQLCQDWHALEEKSSLMRKHGLRSLKGTSRSEAWWSP